MSRWILTRNVARNYVIASRVSKIPPLYHSYLPKPKLKTPLPSLSPQIPHHRFNNPRFLSHQIAQNDDSPENDDSPQNNDVVPPNDSEYVPIEEEEEEEEETYENYEEKFNAVMSLLQESDPDGSLESSLDGVNLRTLHQDFVTGIIETRSISGENLIRFFKWALNKKSFQVTTSVLESLVSAVCGGLRRKEIYSLWDLIKEIGEKENGIVDVTILNELIVSLSKLGKGKAALEVFDKFQGFQCVPNECTYYFTIEALCKRSAFDWAWTVVKKMIDAKCVPDGEKVGNILLWLCKGKKVKEAHELYVAAMEEKKQPPLYCVGLLVGELSRKDETVRLALEVLSDITGEARKRAYKPISAVVRGLCRIKDVDAAKQLVLKMIEDGLPPGNAVFNFVINGYCKVGEMERALEVVRLVESRGLKPDLYAYAVLMSGYSSGGEMEEAMKVLEEAKRKHVKLTPVVYHTLIRGYCKLEQFDKAVKLLAEMKEFGVRPNADEYEKLIHSLCLKALDWEMAEKLLEEMKENGLHLKSITRALIRAGKEMEKEVVEAENISSAA